MKHENRGHLPFVQAMENMPPTESSGAPSLWVTQIADKMPGQPTRPITYIPPATKKIRPYDQGPRLINHWFPCLFPRGEGRLTRHDINHQTQLYRPLRILEHPKQMRFSSLATVRGQNTWRKSHALGGPKWATKRSLGDFRWILEVFGWLLIHGIL